MTDNGIDYKFDEKLNELANNKSNIDRIKNIDKCFGNDDQPLFKQGRVLVGEGILVKICRKNPKKRYFFLFNDILVYGTSVIDKKKYMNKHVIPLKDLLIKSIPDDPKLRNGWSILSPKKSFAVYASSANEKMEWMTHLNNCIQKCSGNRQIKETAPEWIPDKEAETCMRCQKLKFTIYNRRHHCRKCGFVICGDCSKQKVLIKFLSDEPVRVCDDCYMALTSTQNNNESSAESDNDDSTNEYTVSSTNDEPKFYN